MNILHGVINAIHSSERVSMVNVLVEGDVFSAMILEGRAGIINYALHEPISIIFKETEVGIVKGLSGMISFRNRFPGKITQIDQGTVCTNLLIQYHGCEISSIISSKSAAEMQLKEGESIEWLVKSNEISLLKEDHHV